MAELKVVPNEVDGWDVVRDGEGVALSNHPDRETAQQAARLRADEEHLGDADDVVTVESDVVHRIDDTRQGMRTAFLALGGLLLAITILVVILALTGAITGFGAD
jgi:hypothetical protein